MMSSSDDEKFPSCDENETQPFKCVLNRNTNRGWYYYNSNTNQLKDTDSLTNANSWTVTSRVEGVLEAFKNAETDTSDVIPDWSMALVKVRFFVVKNGEIDSENQIGLPIRVAGKDAMKIYMKQVSKLRLSRVHHFATLGEYMHNLNKQQKLADVIVRVKDQIFTANRHALSCHSNFFAKLFINSCVPAYAVTDVTLNDVTTEDFAHFIHFVHIGDIHLSPENVSSLLNLSATLQSETLRAQILVFMSKGTLFSLREAVKVLKDPEEADHRPEALAMIIYKFQELLQHPLYLRQIGLEDLKEVISSEYANINSELDVFWVVLYWSACGQEDRTQYLHELMPFVRFGTMSTMELMDCARASETIGVSHTCRNLLVQANWISYIREKGIKDPLKVPSQYPRLILHDAPSYETTVHEFDIRYLLYKKIASHFDSSVPQDLSIEDDFPVLPKKTQRVKFAEQVEIAEIKPWIEDEGGDLEGVSKRGSTGSEIAPFSELFPEGSADDFHPYFDAASGIVRSDESRPTGGSMAEDKLDYELLSLDNLTKSLMTPGPGAHLGSRTFDADNTDMDEMKSSEAEDTSALSSRDKAVTTKPLLKDLIKELPVVDQEIQSDKEPDFESSQENNPSDHAKETSSNELRNKEDHNLSNLSEIQGPENENENFQGKTSKNVNLSNFIQEEDPQKRCLNILSQNVTTRGILNYNGVNYGMYDVVNVKYCDISSSSMSTGRPDAYGSSTCAESFSESSVKTGVCFGVPVIKNKDNVTCQYKTKDSVSETSRSQEFIDFRCLLDKPEVEMNLIPPPLLHPEATPTWQCALSKEKKRTFTS